MTRWKNCIDYFEYADQARTEKQKYKSHLGGKIYCTLTEGSSCMNIRLHWKPHEEAVPTKKWLCLRALPELDGVVHCYIQSDQRNQLGALQCL